MKKNFCKLTSLAAIILAVWAGTQQPLYSQTSIGLDAAISEAAPYFIGRLPQGARIAVLSFEAPTGRLSDYIVEELWRHFEDSRRFVMVDRRNLDRINAEIIYQYGTGNVEDNLLVPIGRQYGAQILIHGRIIAQGNEYRITMYATGVERSISSQRVFNIRVDSRLSSLLNVSAESEIERAVAAMARSVDQRITVTVGRISFSGTQTVSNFSAWLKDSITAHAQRYRDKFRVATESESSDFAVAAVTRSAANSVIQAVIIGSYSPLDNGAEVFLQLIS